MSPGPELASIRAAMSAGGGGGASRSKAGSVKPGSACEGSSLPTIRRIVSDACYQRPVAVTGGGSALLELVRLLDKGLVRGVLGRQDPIEIRDLLVLDIVLELF